jgi:DNA-directed RNA polymerase subunit L
MKGKPLTKIKLLKKEKNELRIELIGEGATICNMLQNTLFKDDTVEFAGYDIAHPLIANPILYVRTKGRRKPENALIAAAQVLCKETQKIQKTFERALRNNK